MTSQNPQSDIYDPKTLAVMDQAFAAIWHVLRTDDPFRDYANDSELRIAIGHKLMNLVADGVTDPSRLRRLTLESMSPFLKHSSGSDSETLTILDDATFKELLKRVLRRDRAIVGITLLILILLAWLYVGRLATSVQVADMDMTGMRMVSAGSRMVMTSRLQPWNGAEFARHANFAARSLSI